MRVIVYVPHVHGVARKRTVEAVTRELRRRGHEIAGDTERATDAWAALVSGEAERVAGRPEHLLDLGNLPMWSTVPRPWALAVSPSGVLARGVLALPPVAWLGDRIRRHPARTAATGAALAGVVAVLALGLADRAEPPDASPPPTRPAPSATAHPPTTRPPQPPETPGDATPSRTRRLRPSMPPAMVQEETARRTTAAASPPARPRPSNRPPSSPPPTSSPPDELPPPDEVGDAGPDCLIRLDTPLGAVRLLCLHPSGLTS